MSQIEITKGGIFMARMRKLDYQMHLRMEQMKCIGESRHQAKHEYKEMLHVGEHANNKTIGIHSYKTYDAYKQTSIEFSRYMKTNHKDVKDISQVKEVHAVEYLQHRQRDGKSSYTISKDMAALNKLYYFEITKKMAGIKKRSYKDITRSRLSREHDRKYNPNNYADQITLAKATGCRRESVLVIDAKRFTWKNGLPDKIYLKEKGGKERYATIIGEYKEEIKRIIESSNSNHPLFEKYTKKIDNHALRGEYAKQRYTEILGGRSDQKDYRGYDSRVLKVLTRDLGHNRYDVVVYNYLR